MGFDDRYRLSAHAVITDETGRVLLLRATYGDRRWGLPGGAVDPGETLHETVVRECKEELGCDVMLTSFSDFRNYSRTELLRVTNKKRGSDPGFPRSSPALTR